MKKKEIFDRIYKCIMTKDNIFNLTAIQRETNLSWRAIRKNTPKVLSIIRKPNKFLEKILNEFNNKE